MGSWTPPQTGNKTVNLNWNAIAISLGGRGVYSEDIPKIWDYIVSAEKKYGNQAWVLADPMDQTPYSTKDIKLWIRSANGNIEHSDKPCYIRTDMLYEGEENGFLTLNLL
jgi:hypothetical protein